MKASEYFELAARTLSDKGPIMNLEHARIGYKTEIGESFDAIKRFVFYNKPEINVVNLMEELGDCAWYVHIAFMQANSLGIFRDTTSFDHLNLTPYLDEEVTEFSADMFENEDDFDEDENEDIDDDSVLDLNAELCSMLVLIDDASSELELADGMFTAIGRICNALGVPLDVVLQANIAKLAKRYPDKFDNVSAFIRDLSKEEKILEVAIGPYVAEVIENHENTWNALVPQYRSL